MSLAPELLACVACEQTDDAEVLGACDECAAPLHDECQTECWACERPYCPRCFPKGVLCPPCRADQRDRAYDFRRLVAQ